MTSLIVYAIVIAVFAAGIFGFVHSHDSKIRSAQKAEDTVLLNACRANEKTATDANVSLQADVSKARENIETANKATQAWHDLAERAATDAENQHRMNEPLRFALLSQQKSASARAAQTPLAGRSCEQVMTELDADASMRAAIYNAQVLGLPAPVGADKVRVK